VKEKGEEMCSVLHRYDLLRGKSIYGVAMDHWGVCFQIAWRRREKKSTSSTQLCIQNSTI